jgi:hypothetical protein
MGEGPLPSGRAARYAAAMLALLAGCFTPEVEPLVVDEVAFQNAFTQHPNLVLRPLRYPGLPCPDGQDAVAYVIYQEGLSEPAPIAVVFHAGAFDYVYPTTDGTVPDPDDIRATHYAGENRLSVTWASDKVFETLGLVNGTASSAEVNLGTLPAALADAGVVAIYPANCWGDLGHNESGSTPNNWDLDGGVEREGRAFNYLATAVASSDADEAARVRADLGLADVPVPLDGTGVYLLGLGEGGRSVAELLKRSVTGDNVTPIKGIVLDSTMDNLLTMVLDEDFDPYSDGLARIFADGNDDDVDGKVYGDRFGDDNYRDDVVKDIGQFSLARVYSGGPPVPLAFYYSSIDPLVPASTIAGLLALEDKVAPGGRMSVTDSGEAEHGTLNKNDTLAREAVDFLLPS